MPERTHTAVSDYLTATGIGSTPGVLWYVKTGEPAESASASDFARWWAEAETERDSVRVDVAILVVQRSETAGDWWAAMDIATLIRLANPAYVLDDAPACLIRMTLADAIEALRWAGRAAP